MTKTPPTNSSVYRLLCRILGGQDQSALKECVDAGLTPRLFELAQIHDLLPALAVRCHEQGVSSDVVGAERAEVLQQALMDNTQRNMKICAQALKLTRQLNRIGITPLFLKGTAGLLTSAGDSLGFRKQVDIDLIVQSAELEATSDAFLADGYSFCEFPDNTTAVPIELDDTVSAIKMSAAHHHLPPLVKPEYSATVELHRHFLPSRFQRNNPLGPLFGSALTVESHGATFNIPCTEHQIVHLILGKLVHDGHLARRTFPIREACDLIELVEGAKGGVNQQLVLQHCGHRFPLFYALVRELMAYPRQSGIAECGTAERRTAERYIWLMQKRFDSQATGRLLDAYARADYLVHALVYSPGKLSAYLHRLK